MPIEVPAPSRGGRAEAARAAVIPEEVEVAEVPEAEFVSLEEADAEAEGGAKVATGDEDVEVDETLDDAAFIVPEEEEEDDVTDIIGGDIEDEEEFSSPGSVIVRIAAGRLPITDPFPWRGHSSVGRALEWHSRGRRFDSAWLHQLSPCPEALSSATSYSCEQSFPRA